MRALPSGALVLLSCFGVSLACGGSDDGNRGHASGTAGGSAGSAGATSAGGSSNSGGAGANASGGSSATAGGATAGSGMTAGSSGTTGVAGTTSSAGAAGAGGQVCAEQGNMVGMTAAHNAVRATVSAGDPLPELEWSCEIAAVAQAYANVLQGQDCPLDHSGNENYGENIYWRYSDPPSDATPQDVVDGWEVEVNCYTYGQYPNQCTPITDVCADCGHYTAMVWRDTLRVGCGSVRCGKAELWVCNYDPPGNFLGEYPY